MTLRRDVRHGLRIGRAEFVRSLRGYVRNTRRLIGLGLAVLFFGGNLLFALPVAYVVGQTARSVTAIPFFGPAATAVPIGFVLVAMLRTVERIGHAEAEALVLMTVHPRAVVIGLLVAEIGRLLLWFGLPIGALALAFALGLGAPLLLVTGVLVIVPLVCCTAVWGYAGGLGLLRLLRRLPSVRRVLKAVGLLAMVGVIIASQFVGRYVTEASVSIRGLLSGFVFDPLVDYVALAFVGSPIAHPFSAASVVTLVALVTLTPIGLVVATRQASTLWFSDPSSQRPSRQAQTSSGGFDAPRPFAWAKSGRVAWGILVRGGRHPQDLNHLLMAVFFLGPLGSTILQSSGDALGPLLAGTGVGLGTYLAGAAFGLNPLGDDRPQLPLVLLTETAPRAFVRGRLLAGVAVGLPVTVLASLVSVFFGATLGQAIAFAAVGTGMCFAAGLFAVGIGAAYPIYEEREFWGSQSVVPSTLVMMGYLAVVGGGTLIGLVSTWYVVTGNLALTVASGVGLGVYLLLTATVSYGSYRYAVRRYRRYTFE